MATFWVGPPSKAVPEANPSDILLGELTLLSDDAIKSTVGKVKVQCVVGPAPSSPSKGSASSTKKKLTAEERMRDLRVELLSE